MALTLQQTWTLTTDAAFLGRIRAAVALTAYDVVNEAPATPSHEQRVALARSALSSPSEAPFFAWLLVHPLVQANGATITDTDLRNVVSALWNVACGAATTF